MWDPLNNIGDLHAAFLEQVRAELAESAGDTGSPRRCPFACLLLERRRQQEVGQIPRDASRGGGLEQLGGPALVVDRMGGLAARQADLARGAG